MSRVSISGCRQAWLMPFGITRIRQVLDKMLAKAQTSSQVRPELGAGIGLENGAELRAVSGHDALPGERPEPALSLSLELHLVRDGVMSDLNNRHLGCVGPTNVLAFQSGADEDFLGSLVLCVDAVRREAMLYGQDEAGYCQRLLAHGLAHLLGHDHGPRMDALCEDLLHDAS